MRWCCPTEAIVKIAPDSGERDFASIARKARMNGCWRATSSEPLKGSLAGLMPSFSAVMFLLDGAARYRMIHPDEFIWGAVSRAVRTPTRFDTDTEVTLPGVRLLGNPDFKSEAVAAFESGYRSRVARRLSIDIATFFNIYDNLRNSEPRGLP